MKKWQRSIIVKNKPDLINLITPNAELLSLLEASEILSNIELEELDCFGNQKSRTDQATKLLNILVKRDKASDGQYVFDVLINALNKSKQRKPAKILEKGKQKYQLSIRQHPRFQVKQKQGCTFSHATIATSSEPPRSSQSNCLPPPQKIAKTSSSLNEEYFHDNVGLQGSRTDQATKMLDTLVNRNKALDGQHMLDVLINALKESKQGKPAGILEQGKKDYLSNPGQPPKQQEKQQKGGFPSNVISSETKNVTIANLSEPLLPSQSPCLLPPQQQIVKTSSLKDEYLRVMDTKLNVKIDKPSSWNSSLPDGAYNINPDKPGAVLIISIREFAPYQLWTNGNVQSRNISRTVAELDAKYMRDLWSGLGYTIFREEEIDWEEGRWTREDILDMIKAFRNFCDKKKPDSVVIFIGSHGEYDTILTSDPPDIVPDGSGGQKAIHQKIKIRSEVLTQFYDGNCPGLIGKPKLFLINSCQVFPSENTDKIPIVRSPASDLIVVFSQAPGLVSVTNPKTGSWFVHCFTFVMMKSVKERDFEDVINEVARILQERYFVGVDEDGIKFQHGHAPTKLTLGSTKKLYFPLKP